MTDEASQVRKVMNQFGEDVPIKIIAQYLQDEFFIPFDKAVNMIHDLAIEEI